MEEVQELLDQTTSLVHYLSCQNICDMPEDVVKALLKSALSNLNQATEIINPD